jgi:hypothetical protein
MLKSWLFGFLFLGVAVSSCDVFSSVLSSAGGGGVAELTNTQMIQGLKEALNQGVTKGVSALNVQDGFFKNAALKILFPPEAHKVEKTLRDVGLGNFADEAILKMNRAAEDAAGGAKDIFIGAITGMTVTDALGIIKGPKNGCTEYLKRTCSTALYQKMQPVIKNSLSKVGAVNAWSTAITQYNKIPMVQKMNPSLDDHVTNKSVDGIFSMISKEELNIRANPLQRGTDLMKKVFAKQDS